MNWKKAAINTVFLVGATGGIYAYAERDDRQSAQELGDFADRFNNASFTVEAAKQAVDNDQFREQRIALNNCLADQLPGRTATSAYQGDTYVTTTMVPSYTIDRGALQDCIKSEKTNHSAHVIAGASGIGLGYLLLHTPIPFFSRRRRDDDNKPKFGEFPPANNLS